jgi:hypothetical protein
MSRLIGEKGMILELGLLLLAIQLPEEGKKMKTLKLNTKSHIPPKTNPFIDVLCPDGKKETMKAYREEPTTLREFIRTHQ